MFFLSHTVLNGSSLQTSINFQEMGAKVQQSGVQIEFSSYYFLTWPPLLLNLTTTATKIKSFTDKKGPSGVKENAPRVLRHLRHEIWCISAKKRVLFNEVGQAHCSCGSIWVVDTFFALIQGNAIQVWCIFKGHHFEWWDFSPLKSWLTFLNGGPL